LAFVPRLPSAGASNGLGVSGGSLRIAGGTGRKQRVFAVTQIAASFVLLAGASMLVKTLLAMQAADTGFDTHRVLALNVPVMSYGRTPDQVVGFYKEAIRRITELPGVDGVALGTVVPWRDAGNFGPGFEFSADGRDFNDADRRGGEPVVIVSQTLARRMFPNQDAVNRHIMWTDPVMKFVEISPAPRRIVGVTADVDDENVVPGPALTVFHPFGQEQIWGGRLFVHTGPNPYALVSPVTRIIRNMSADQVVERAATLEDIRAEVLTPDRLNTFVFGGFAIVALAIAVVGVAGVLAFSVSGRTREFGIRLAIGSQPRHLLTAVIAMAAVGIVLGAAGGYALAKLAGAYFQEVRMPDAVAVAGSAVVLLAAAVVASVVPAARAARVDVMQALRSD
jgi:hypothetical protein